MWLHYSVIASWSSLRTVSNLNEIMKLIIAIKATGGGCKSLHVAMFFTSVKPFLEVTRLC